MAEVHVVTDPAAGILTLTATFAALTPGGVVTYSLTGPDGARHPGW